MKGKFLGDTKGNKNLKTNRSSEIGGSGESHSKVGSGKFLGSTKGNKDLPTNRSSNVAGGHGGGMHKAGGKK